MIIRGNTVGSTALGPDYGQTDPSRADYIANKPDAAIAKAQAAAESAQKAAGAALPKSGGTMTGAIDMGGKGLTNLPEPQADTDPATFGSLKRYVNEKYLSAQLTLTASGWSDAAPYTQTVSVVGILATDRPHYGVVYAAGLETALAQKEAFALVDDLDTAAGSVTFTCFEDKPGVDLIIQLEVNR